MSDEMTAEQYRDQFAEDAKPKRNKYGNTWTTVEWDGVPYKFQSKAEAARFLELKQMEQGGMIADLELQPRYPLLGPNGTKVATYIADFAYHDNQEGRIRVEDVKSSYTRKQAHYRQKRKHFEDQYEIPLEEVIK